MKYATPIIWFSQCAIWLYNAVAAGVEHNWKAMVAFIWIIVLCITIGFETILRNKMSEELRKLSEENNESRLTLGVATTAAMTGVKAITQFKDSALNKQQRQNSKKTIHTAVINVADDLTGITKSSG